MLFTSCDPVETGGQTDKPEGLIPKKKMTQMLIDAHVIEGARSGVRVLGDTVSVDVYYKSFYDKYEVTKAQYDSSFRYYSHFPREMMEMYSVVIDSLNLREMQVEGQVREYDARKLEEANRRIDSLQNQ